MSFIPVYFVVYLGQSTHVEVEGQKAFIPRDAFGQAVRELRFAKRLAAPCV